MKIKAQVSMVMNLDKCIGCHTCSVTCKNTWTNRPGAEYIWFNNVETKPGVGYPIEWENQEKHKGGWALKNNQLELKSGSKLSKLALGKIFHNPDLPTIDEYYEPWTYDYEKLLNSPQKRHQPVARPKSLLTGETMELEWGPNWEDNLAGAHVTGQKDPNIRKLGEAIKLEFEQAFMMYMPRICEHCLNPGCVASCPSGAIYKRDEDGIVLVDQEQCRGWRYCMTGCPYKKVYFNWETQKAEKCTFCFPRIEAGLPTVCSETCTGRIRYIGILLYDADRVKEVASTPNEKDLYKEQLSLFLDPNDPEVIEQAKKDGISEDWLEAARKSPIYKLAIKYKIALPLHPEYRTLPMVWYVPPLSPFTTMFEGKDINSTLEEMFPAISQMRIPLEYLANMLTAGDTDVIKQVLEKMVIMRHHMRAKTLGKKPNEQMLKQIGMTTEVIEEMYRLLAIAKYEDRFVIPPAHKEHFNNLYGEQGSIGYSFDCNTCKVGGYDGAKDEFHVLKR
ncbi:Respiratory nitrate reductase 1 beta chain [Neobacillus rhizosphaerae]|uniref:Respiratory nitrate reductase 1 beta chain n=1 Tax=Neobacillus rhizosphaerae TaxID=2880965 RepID=A0ABM9ET42_9BACI|nr:nitrate reductase subunit beta [Neobacillus rhizosphaerae]CAH2715812.1 Respiratory nitrate reductase 1 beta chain [Neobacillus rhizosphaerae]